MSTDSCVDDHSDVTCETVDTGSNFRIEFYDSFVFRNLIDFLRLSNYEGSFRFTPDGIYYDQSNSDDSMLNVVRIQAYKLTNYEFHSSTNKITLSFVMSELRNISRAFGKKDKVVLHKLPEDGKMYAQIFTNSAQSNKDPPFHIINTVEPSYCEYDMPIYKKGIGHPICTVSQAEFNKMCTNFVSIRCAYIKAHIFPKGIRFRAMSASNKQMFIDTLGQCEDQDESHAADLSDLKMSLKNISNVVVRRPDNPITTLNIGEAGEITNICIDTVKIKALQKINNLSSVGTVRIYMEPGTPMRIDVDVGNFGDLSIYIKDIHI